MLCGPHLTHFALSFFRKPRPEPGELLVEQVGGNVAGTFTGTPSGVILHGSRSGQSQYTIEQEYTGTVNYVRGGAGGELGWHATVGDRKITVHMAPNQWGWNARAASSKYIAVELAQAVEAHDITDGQITALVWYIKEVQKTYPNLPLNFPTHAELEKRGETGKIDGKTDVFSNGSPRADELRARILAWF